MPDESFAEAFAQNATPEQIGLCFPLFTERDIRAMSKAFNLASYDDVVPSERMTLLRRENWQRSTGPKLRDAGLEWINFQVMRRTHASLMSDLGVEGKLVADQLGHSLDVNRNVYTQSAVSKRQMAVNRLEHSLNGVQTEFTVSESALIDCKLLQ